MKKQVHPALTITGIVVVIAVVAYFFMKNATPQEYPGLNAKQAAAPREDGTVHATTNLPTSRPVDAAAARKMGIPGVVPNAK